MPCIACAARASAGIAAVEEPEPVVIDPASVMLPEASRVEEAEGVATVVELADVTMALEPARPDITPETDAHWGLAEAPRVWRNWPEVPGERSDHVEAPR